MSSRFPSAMQATRRGSGSRKMSLVYISPSGLCLVASGNFVAFGSGLCSAASLLTHYYLYLNSQCRTRVTYSQQTDEDVLIGWRSEGIPKPSPSEIQLYRYLSLCTRYMITYMILLLQPGEVQRDACQAMVGREPSEDTRTVPLRRPLTIRTA